MAEHEEEMNRKGEYDLAFPTKANIDTYEKFFEADRRSNQLLWQYIRSGHGKHMLINYL
jgi:hypothetical protein